MERQKVRTVQAFALATLLSMDGGTALVAPQKRDGIGSTMSAAPDRPGLVAGGRSSVVPAIAPDTSSPSIFRSSMTKHFQIAARMPATRIHIAGGALLRDTPANSETWGRVRCLESQSQQSPAKRCVILVVALEHWHQGHGLGQWRVVSSSCRTSHADDPVDAYTQLIVLLARFPWMDGPTFWSPLKRMVVAPRLASRARGRVRLRAFSRALSGCRDSARVELNGNRCSFSLKPGTAGAYQAFAQISIIRGAVIGVSAISPLPEQKSWSARGRRTMRIFPTPEAFFPAEVRATAPNGSRLNQRNFQCAHRPWMVPVIRVTLPTVPSGPATFAFSPVDQDIP